MSLVDAAETSAQLAARARALLDLRRPAEALPLLRQAATDAPDDAHPRRLLALALLRTGDPEAALEAAGQAVALDPDDEWGRRLQSRILMASDRPADALAAARQAVRLAPTGAEAWFALGDAALANGQPEEARQAARQIADADPLTANAELLLGDISLVADQPAVAEAHYQRALAKEPDSYAALNNLGIALLRQRRYQEATDRFHGAARLDPSAPAARGNAVVAARAALDAGRPPQWVAALALALIVFGAFAPFVWMGIALFFAVRQVTHWRTRRRRLGALHPAVASHYRRLEGRQLRACLAVTAARGHARRRVWPVVCADDSPGADHAQLRRLHGRRHGPGALVVRLGLRGLRTPP
ncbi:MAG: tetratricopeptide repeat protein [Dehalococcoidia bacterium]